MPKEPCTCPSSTCDEDALLFGVVGPDGRVGYVSPPVPVDSSFLDQVSATGVRPEQRFRFAGPCVQERCMQWANGRCGAIDIALSAGVSVDDDSGLPACGIRRSCRWFRQSGSAACRACPLIITQADPEVA
jgi:hypothetical protein